MFRKFAAVLSLVGVFAACGDSTGPEDFDPVVVNGKAEAVLSAFDGNEALLALSVLGPAMQFSTAAPVFSVVPFDPTDGTAVAATRMRELREVLPSFGSSGSLALFPVDLLGTTYVYNTNTGEYEIDANATGAPADGVRFILYAVDPILFEVVEPLDPVGYLDLIDVSTASEDALQIVAVVGSVTYLDYTASVAQGTSSATIAAEGFLSNGSDQVDFDLSLTATLSQVSLDYQLSTDEGSVRLEALMGSDDSIGATLTLEGDGDTIILDITITPSTVSGEITYNGDVVVTVAGTPESPTFTKPDGTPLTQAEINALEGFGEIVGNLFDAFDNLLWPALLVFALGN
jgi:hypothetical protein